MRLVQFGLFCWEAAQAIVAASFVQCMSTLGDAPRLSWCSLAEAWILTVEREYQFWGLKLDHPARVRSGIAFPTAIRYIAGARVFSQGRRPLRSHQIQEPSKYLAGCAKNYFGV